MYPIPKKGRKVTTSYSHRFGVVQEKKSGLRFFVLVLFIITGSISLAVLQFGQELDNILKDSSSSSALAQEQTSQQTPIKPLVAPVNSADAPYLDQNLQRLLERWNDSHADHDWSVVVRGLDSDKRFASLRGGSWYVPASIYKLMLSYSVFRHYGLDQLNKTTVQIGKERVSFKTCMDRMLRVSDNPCGDAIGKQLGWWKVESDLQKAGFNNTVVNRKDAMFTSAEDAASFMVRLYEDKLLAKDAKEYILSTLASQTLRKGIPAGCEGCWVANKTGDLNNVRHDVALIQKDGKTYVLSIFTSGASFDQIAELTKQVNAYMSSTSAQP